MKIVIAGYGIEGRSSYQYFKQAYPDAEVVIVDEKPVDDIPDGATFVSGEGVFKRLHDADLVIRTASLPPTEIITHGKIWSSTNEFFQTCPAQIIGVTGTKGKGTTSSMITSLLRAAGKTVHMVGNIGVAALDQLPLIAPNDVVVFELSSFQLWDIERSPHIAVILGIEPDHLDVHKDLNDYIGAKGNIRKFQTKNDVCFYHPTNQISHRLATVHDGAMRYGIMDDGGVYVQDGSFKKGEHILCSIDAIRVPGQHNVENACAALSVASLFTMSSDVLHQGLSSFEGLPHRLKFVRKLDGVSFYDDSYSTAPTASKAALSAFESPGVIILGGHNKGARFDELALIIARSETIKKVVLMGQTRHLIFDSFKKNGVSLDRIEICDSVDFEFIVKKAVSFTEPGDVVVLSPACASFGMFENAIDRGEQFIEIVNRL